MDLPFESVERYLGGSFGIDADRMPDAVSVSL
jgi:hypothetical protein